jgi:2-phosphosulfolactate phosphatase
VRLDVYLTPGELQPGALNGAVVAVIDVLRASTTIAVALNNGAKAVIPFEEADDVVTSAKQFKRSEVCLAGERKMLPIPGFDCGNSPHEFTREVVEGKPVLLTTTNGTHALLATQGARDTVVASYVNSAAVAALLRSAARSGQNIALVCSGQDRHFALEDAACAGRYVSLITELGQDVILNDAARACALIDKTYGNDLQALFLDAAHGRALQAAGFNDDLVICAQVDAFPVVPVYTDRQITKLGTDRGR